MIPTWDIEPGATFEGRHKKLREVLSVDRENEQVRFLDLTTDKPSIARLVEFQRWIIKEVEVCKHTKLLKPCLCAGTGLALKPLG